VIFEDVFTTQYVLQNRTVLFIRDTCSDAPFQVRELDRAPHRAVDQFTRR